MKIGTLEADITADTSGLKKAESEIKRTGRKMERDLGGANKAVQAGFKKTGKVAQASFTGVAPAANAATGAMKNMGNVSRQLGYQVQDVAVQLQSGTNAMMIMSQQGSQIASIFGPGGAVIGAIVAIAGAVAGALLPSLFSSKDASDELEVSLEELNETALITAGGVVVLTEKITKLAKESESAARAEIQGALLSAMEAISTASEEAGSTMEDAFGIDTAQSVNHLSGKLLLVKKILDEFGISQDQFNSIQSAMSAFDDDDSVQNLTELQRVLDGVASSGDAKPVFVKLANDLREYSGAASEAQKKTDALKAIQDDLNTALKAADDESTGRTKAVERQIAALTVEAETYGKSRVEIELYKAALLGAEPAELNEIRIKAEQITKLKEEEKARTDAAKAAEKASRDAERDAKKAEKDAERAREKARKDAERIELDEQRRQKSAAPKIAAISQLGESDLEKIARQEQERRAFILEQTQLTADQQKLLLQEIAEERVRAEQQLNDKLAAVAEQATDRIANQQESLRQSSLSAMSQLGNDMNEVLRATGKEGSGIAKAIFMAMKAIQVAQIIAATEVAAANAAAVMALGGPVPYFATASAVRAVGYTSAALVAGLAVGGGRQFGGSVSPQMAHPINEAGIPEILNQGGKQFLLPTGKGGNISPIDKGSAGSGQANVTIISNGTPQSVDGVNITRDEIAIMINDSARRTEGRINGSLATGRGDTATSLKTGFKTERNLR